MSAEEDIAAANEEEANRDILKPINVDYGDADEDAPADELDLQYDNHSKFYRNVLMPNTDKLA